MRLDRYNEISNKIADRLGAPANADHNWFDNQVAYWSDPGGMRLLSIELSYLGRKIPDWILVGKLDIPKEIFEEMESMLSEGFGSEIGGRARELAIYVLEGIQAESLAIDRVADRDSLTRVLKAQMGDETKLLWASRPR